MSDEAREQRETDAAAAEAAAIGGRPSDTPDPSVDEAERPLAEAGQGEAEGFEQAEAELIDHASHGDQHAARHVIEEADGDDEDARASGGGEADREYSTAREDDR